MRRNLFDVEYSKPMLRENFFDGAERKIGEVFMIDGVELVICHDPHEVREFHRHDALWFEQYLEALHEIIEIGHMRQYVIADDEVRLPPLGRQLPCCLCTEKFYQGGNAVFDGDLGYVFCRLDAHHRNSSGHEILQQISIIARNFDDITLTAQLEAIDHQIRIRL